jgi:hypothetical protein
VRANLGSRRTLGELRGRDGEVEQEVDAKTCLHVEEVRTCGRIEAKPDGRYLAVGDRRDFLSLFVHTRDESESAAVEQRDHLPETVAWMRDHEIEIARHSARSQHHKSYSSDQYWLEAEAAQTLDNFADCLAMIDRSGTHDLGG